MPPKRLTGPMPAAMLVSASPTPGPGRLTGRPGSHARPLSASDRTWCGGKNPGCGDPDTRVAGAGSAQAAPGPARMAAGLENPDLIMFPFALKAPATAGRPGEGGNDLAVPGGGYSRTEAAPVTMAPHVSTPHHRSRQVAYSLRQRVGWLTRPHTGSLRCSACAPAAIIPAGRTWWPICPGWPRSCSGSPPRSMSWPAPAAWPTSARRLPALTGGPDGGWAGSGAASRASACLEPATWSPAPARSRSPGCSWHHGRPVTAAATSRAGDPDRSRPQS